MKRSRPTSPNAALMMTTAFHSYDESQAFGFDTVDSPCSEDVLVAITMNRFGPEAYPRMTECEGE